MAITEGSAGLLPKSADTLPLTAPAFHGIAADATTNPAMWAQRSMAAGDGLNYRYVVASGLYLKNGSSADAGVNATGIASGRGLAATLFGATGTTPLFPNAAALADGDSLPTTTKAGVVLYCYDGSVLRLVKQASPTGGNAGTTGAPVASPHLWNGTNYTPLGSVAGVADGVGGFNTQSAGGYRYNGTTWDRERGNAEGTLLAAAARTSNTTTTTQTNHNDRGVELFLNVTANPGGAETLTINLYHPDPVSAAQGAQRASFTTPAATNGVYRLTVYPGATYTPESAPNDKHVSLPLPRSWTVLIQHSGGGSWTYSLGYSLIA